MATIGIAGLGSRWRSLVGTSESLRGKATAGAVWVLVGYAASQVLRVASNLVLTRLLFPEAFGLMALVQVFLSGLQMFSDVGIRTSIVQNKRGDDRTFIDTAWTLQAMRGTGLWIACLIGALPFAYFYGEASLATLIPVAGLSALLAGVNSSKLALADRRLEFKRVTLIEIGSQFCAVAVMIVWAAIWPSVWALVAGGLIRVALIMMASHYLLPGRNNSFRWDRDSLSDLIGFGKWVFVSTAASFVLQQGDKLVLGKLLDLKMLGVYAIALFVAKSVLDAQRTIGQRVLFPVYSTINRSANRRDSKITSIRVTSNWVFLPPLLACVLYGPEIVRILYPIEYVEAGWMLQVIASGYVAYSITIASSGLLLAVGDSRRYMITQVVRGVLTVVGMLVGYFMASLPGLLVGVAAGHWISYVPVALAVHKYGGWSKIADCVTAAVCLVVIAAAIALTQGAGS